MIKVGDYVSRNSYNNDVIFVVKKIENNICYLKGAFERLIADSPLEDLKKEEKVNETFEAKRPTIEEREDYFFLPGKILHIDADMDYLNKCLNYYKASKIWAKGKCLLEKEVPSEIINLIKEYNPNIVVITGHDSYNKNKNTYKKIAL